MAAAEGPFLETMFGPPCSSRVAPWSDSCGCGIAKDTTCSSTPWKGTATPATFLSIWTAPRTTSSTKCVPMGMSLVSCCAPAPATVRETRVPHLQAWVCVSLTPLEPTLATSVARHLAHLYGADRASADGRHWGRLAGFTNQKPSRRQLSGYAPWVRLLYAQTRLATQAPSLLETAPRLFPAACPPIPSSPPPSYPPGAACSLTPAAAMRIYSR